MVCHPRNPQAACAELVEGGSILTWQTVTQRRKMDPGQEAYRGDSSPYTVKRTNPFQG